MKTPFPPRPLFIVMGPNQKSRQLNVYCYGCYLHDKNGFPNKKPKFPAKKRQDGTIKSKSLEYHITHDLQCKEVYDRVYPDRNNFETSLWKHCAAKSARSDVRTTSMNGLGLASICNDRSEELNLDRQVNYNAVVGHIDRSLIEQRLNEDIPLLPHEGSVGSGFPMEDHDSDVPDGDTSDSIEDNNVALTQGAQTTITTPSHNSSSVSGSMKVRIKLMKIMRDHNMPLCAEREICHWASEAHFTDGFSWGNADHVYMKRPTIMKQIGAVAPHHFREPFRPKLIDWCEKAIPNVHEGVSNQQIYVRSFKDALTSLLTNVTLMKEENLSFPNKETPLSYENNPPMEGSTEITELHHGNWWGNTWKQKCSAEKNEILVPIILYMDGVAIDKHGKTSITPLNLTLGILSTHTRAVRPDAWETIYYHPSRKGENATDNLVNLHSGIREALSTLKDACNDEDGVLWTNLPWNGKTWSVRLKFSVAFVIGDTELHDKLCCHYCSRVSNVSKTCRHCNCPSGFINRPTAHFENPDRELYTPLTFTSPSLRGADKIGYLNFVEKKRKLTASEKAFSMYVSSVKRCRATDPTPPEMGDIERKLYFQYYSHHDVSNAFHDIDFGANRRNIHAACMSELLHFHQHGAQLRSVETFKTDFLVPRIHDDIESITSFYGPLVARQSDRRFPRTRFSNTLSTKMKEGNQYAGMILLQMLAMLSSEGRTILIQRGGKTQAVIDRRIYTLELLLGMEEFLKHSATKKTMKNLKKMVVHFMNNINENLPRSAGEGQKLIKNHMFFHLPECVELFGPPSGWDSSPSESNHKIDVKAPALRTQHNPSTLDNQTGYHYIQNRAIDSLDAEYDLYGCRQSGKDSSIGGNTAGGSFFRIGIDEAGDRFMNWVLKKNKSVPTHPDEVIRFVTDIPGVSSASIEGFTEHKRGKLMFRAHSSYRSDTGQVTNLWYDWAKFWVDGPITRPVHATSQILCFINLPDFVPSSRFPDATPGYYAVVRCLGKETAVKSFAQGSHRTRTHSFVKESKLEPGFHLFPCDSILSEAAVVINKGSNPQSHFVLENKEFWLHDFRNKMDSFETKTLKSFLSAGVDFH